MESLVMLLLLLLLLLSLLLLAVVVNDGSKFASLRQYLPCNVEVISVVIN